MPGTVLDSYDAQNIKISVDWGGGGCFGSTWQWHWLSKCQRCHLPGSDKWKRKRWLEIIPLKEGKTSRKKYLWRARDERDKGMVRKQKKSGLEEYQAFIISEYIFSWALNVCQALLLICPTWFWTQNYEEVLLSACCSGRNGRNESLSHTCSYTPRSDAINFED